MFDIEQTRGELSIIIEFCFLSNPSCWDGRTTVRGHFIHNRIYGVWDPNLSKVMDLKSKIFAQILFSFQWPQLRSHKSEPICISPSDTVDKSHLKKSHIYLASFCKQLKMTQFFQIRMVSKSIITGNCRASGIRENGRFLTFWNEKKYQTWIYSKYCTTLNWPKQDFWPEMKVTILL